MPFMIHVEIGISRRAVAHPVLRADEINAIALVDQQMPEIVPVAIEPLTRFGNGIAERHDLDGGVRS